MNQAPRYFALIPAAGVGARMGAGSPKQYLKIGGKPMLRHTLDAFLSSDLIAHTFVVVSPDDPYIDSVAPNHGVTVLRCGGASRMESVRNGLAVLANTLAPTDWVLVHDAARPGLNAELIEKLIHCLFGRAPRHLPGARPDPGRGETGRRRIPRALHGHDSRTAGDGEARRDHRREDRHRHLLAREIRRRHLDADLRCRGCRRCRHCLP